MATSSTPTVLLISNDGREVTATLKAVQQSAMLNDMIADLELGPETLAQGIPLSEIDGKTLEKVMEWCEHAAAHAEAETEESKTAAQKSLILAYDQELLFDVIKAANFLQVEALLRQGCRRVADMVAGKSTAEMREVLGIETDFTPEEEAKLRAESSWVHNAEPEPYKPTPHPGIAAFFR
ncbi:Skp1 family, dimerization domain-containing protein [Xylariomycetidae sp. FL2044]|nr:Skp1 family, dimerization domain-containing protein [Xylariomycetidae sp. FL2044]